MSVPLVASCEENTRGNDAVLGYGGRPEHSTWAGVSWNKGEERDGEAREWVENGVQKEMSKNSPGGKTTNGKSLA